MNDQIEIAQAAASASIASKASYGASLGTVLTSAATAQWVGVIIGALIGLATFWAGWHWRRREFDARRSHEARELALQMAERDIKGLSRG